MIFGETPLAGAYLIDLERFEDNRGFFARSFCQREFQQHGLQTCIAQCNVSFNARVGTLRGLHYQARPHEETKVVRCTHGAIWDVFVDIRQESPTYAKWYAVELSAESRRAVYIPPGFAHGFQTLTEGAEVLYMMSEFYHSDSARGVRWDDPKFDIRWPLPDPIMSERDRSYPLLP